MQKRQVAGATMQGYEGRLQVGRHRRIPGELHVASENQRELQPLVACSDARQGGKAASPACVLDGGSETYLVSFTRYLKNSNGQHVRTHRCVRVQVGCRCACH